MSVVWLYTLNYSEENYAVINSFKRSGRHQLIIIADVSGGGGGEAEAKRYHGRLTGPSGRLERTDAQDLRISSDWHSEVLLQWDLMLLFFLRIHNLSTRTTTWHRTQGAAYAGTDVDLISIYSWMEKQNQLQPFPGTSSQNQNMQQSASRPLKVFIQHHVHLSQWVHFRIKAP